MSTEIERKWLAEVTGNIIVKRSRVIESAYLTVGDPEVRVARYRGVRGSYQITVKKGKGIERAEIVVDVDDEKGLLMFNLAEHGVSKIRDDVDIDWKATGEQPIYPGERASYTHPWEVDTYLGAFAGICVVEIELPSKRAKLPPVPWGLRLLREVTEDARWKNKAMAEATPELVAQLRREYAEARAENLLGAA